MTVNISRIEHIRIWLDAREEVVVLFKKVNEMLQNGPIEGAEEYAIHDYEGDFGCMLNEYSGLEQAHEIACFLDDFPEIGALLANHFCDLDDAKKYAEDNYIGCYKSIADYAQELTEGIT